MAKYDVEYTDLYAGQVNYSWVHRYEIEAPDNATSTQLVRLAKAVIGLTGVRCVKTDFGDTIELRPQGGITIAFITYKDEG